MAGLDTGCSSRSGKTFWDAIHLSGSECQAWKLSQFCCHREESDRFSTVGMTFDGTKVPGGLKAEKVIRDLWTFSGVNQASGITTQ